MPKKKQRKDVGTPHKGEHLAQVRVGEKTYDVHAWGKERRRVYRAGRFVGMYEAEKDFTEGVKGIIS